MNYNDFKPIHYWARKTGAKILLYGPPGTRKTPLIAQIPHSGIVFCEPGLSSVYNQDRPSKTAYDFETLDEVNKLFLNPNSLVSRQFHTIIYDSLTAMCQIVLRHYKKKFKDGRQAYGEMADYVFGVVEALCKMEQLNVIFVAQRSKETIIEMPNGILGQEKHTTVHKPKFPGKDLDERIPHEIDEILYINNVTNYKGYTGPAIHTVNTDKTFVARSRSGVLQPIEPPDLNAIMNKINSRRI